MIKIKKIITLCCLIILGYSPVLFSVDFVASPSLALRTEYDDNIEGSAANEVDDYIAQVTPALKITGKTERSSIGLSANATRYLYSDNDEYDHTDQNYMGDFYFKPGILTGIRGNASYSVTYRPDRDIDITGLIVSNDKRETMDSGMGVEFSLSEKSTLSVSGGYMDEKWSGNIDSQDLKAFYGSFGYTIDLSKLLERTIGRFNAGYANYEYETSESDYYYATAGIKYQFTETVNLLVDIGINNTDTDYSVQQLYFDPSLGFQIRTVEQNNKEYGGVGTVVLEKRGEFARGSLRISQDIKPSSSRGSNVERSEFVLNWRKQFAEISSLGISGGLFKNKADAGSYGYSAIDENTFFIRPSMRWEIFPDFMLDTGYYYSYTKDRIDDNSRRHNLVFLQISYGIRLMD